MKEDMQDYMATIFVAVFFLSFGFLMQVMAWWFIFTGGPGFFKLFSMILIYGGIWMIYFGTIIPSSSTESRPEYRETSRFPTAPRAQRIPVRQAYARMGPGHHPGMGRRVPLPGAPRAYPKDWHPES